ncbi:MAG: type II toxin-antitoxin system Phd/YefM family antitoxin [Rhodospirillales bacterium]|nr:type II toxin-antitoxin system Phd/YefM family antitoxin [Rhodospirillales bacterium]
MKTVNIHDAKTHLSKLIARVRKGEEIVLAKAGKPVAKIVPFESGPKRRVPGSARGLFALSDDFDAPLPDDILDAFEGKA